MIFHAAKNVYSYQQSLKKIFLRNERNIISYSLRNKSRTKPEKTMRVALLANIKPRQNVAHWHEQFEDDTFAEWDSVETIEAVRDALASDPNVECEIVEAVPEIALPRLMIRKYDIVFNIAEGMRGAD